MKPEKWTAEDAGRALSQVLTLRRDLARMEAVAVLASSKAARQAVPVLKKLAAKEADLEIFYRANEPEDRKSIQLQHGLIGVRSPSDPALVPLDEKWTWDKIARKLKRTFGLKYFHKPKPPGVDKAKVKSKLTAEVMERCGLKLDTEESFYIDLNRVARAGKKP